MCSVSFINFFVSSVASSTFFVTRLPLVLTTAFADPILSMFVRWVWSSPSFAPWQSPRTIATEREVEVDGATVPFLFFVAFLLEDYVSR